MCNLYLWELAMSGCINPPAQVHKAPNDKSKKSGFWSKIKIGVFCLFPVQNQQF
jgi:hypothetical protein